MYHLKNALERQIGKESDMSEIREDFRGRIGARYSGLHPVVRNPCPLKKHKKLREKAGLRHLDKPKNIINCRKIAVPSLAPIPREDAEKWIAEYNESHVIRPQRGR